MIEIEHQDDSVPSLAPQRAVRARALLLGAALLFPLCYWTTQLEMVRYNFPTYAVPFYTVIVTMLVLLGANALVRRLKPAAALNTAELLTLYVMLSAATALWSIAFTYQAVLLMGHAYWFANTANKWGDLILPHLPRWLTVSDHAALRNYYLGYSTFYRWEHLRAWAPPALWWCLFIVVMVWTMLCLNVLLRKQWTERERLAYPVIELPLQMITEPHFFRNRLLWAGFAIAGSISLINGLNALFPFVPTIPVKRQPIPFGDLSPPWNVLQGTQTAFYPFAIGMGFIMPLELSFSCWMFFIFHKVQLVVASALGWGHLPKFPYPREQAFGAYVAIFLAMMFTGARQWIGAKLAKLAKFDRANPNQSQPTSANLSQPELLPYPFAFLGALGGFAFLVAFSVLAGMSLWVAVTFFAMFFMLSIMITRIRAELGFPVHDLMYMGPTQIMPELLGPSALGARNLSVFALFHWFNRFYLSHPMPHQLEGFKLADKGGFHRRAIIWAVMLGTVIGAPLAFWTMLHIYYQTGATTTRPGVWGYGFGNETYGRTAHWMLMPTEVDKVGWGCLSAGFLFTLLLIVLRLRVPGFPLHPLGYAVAPSWGLMQLWLCLLIASGVKFCLLQYGGLKAYRQALPFFFGLILGDFVVGSFWTLFGVVTGIQTYDFWP